MKKIALLLILFLWTENSLAQNISFEQQVPVFPYGIPMKADLSKGNNIKYVDVDSDGDQDIFLTGTYNYHKISNLYINDGLGIFTKKENTNIIGIGRSTSDFADIDNDGDLDLILCGALDSYQEYIKIYLNDGQANFTEAPQNYFPNEQRKLKLADINSDGNIDIILYKDQEINTYINDGQGHYSELANPNFSSLYHNFISVADIDQDGDVDILLTGLEGSTNTPHSILYQNNGTGLFTEITNTSLTNVYDATSVFVDMNNDHYPDLFINGKENQSTNTTKVYFNDGTGTFVENTLASNTLPDTYDYGYKFYDFDNDNDYDLFITGQNQVTLPNGSTAEYASLYINDGTGNFSLDPNFKNIYRRKFHVSVDITDVNNDQKPDILITGKTSPNGASHTYLFAQNSLGEYEPLYGSYFNKLPFYHKTTKLIDYDNDGDLDVFVHGSDYLHRLKTYIYRNEGAATFSAITSIANNQIDFNSQVVRNIDIVDLDDDGDKDYVVVVYENSKYICKLYYNDGNNQFTEQLLMPTTDHYYYSYFVADLNGDNKKDFIVAILSTQSSSAYTKILLNNGNGIIGNSYTEVSNLPFTDPNRHITSLRIIDVDGDQDLDIVTLENNSDIKMYLNDGQANFVPMTGSVYSGGFIKSFDLKDINNDNYVDIVLSDNATSTKVLLSYGSFYYVENTQTFPVQNEVKFVDFDSDGDYDLYLSGSYNSLQNIYFTDIYENEGNNHFTRINNLPLIPMKSEITMFGDLNGDQKTDILTFGDANFTTLSKIYLNNGNFASISENTTETSFKIFPNPTKNGFKIISKLKTNNIDVNIFDLKGVQLYEFKNCDITNKHFNPKLKKGVYLVQITNNKQIRETYKLIIK